jgi:hypothetical protein
MVSSTRVKTIANQSRSESLEAIEFSFGREFGCARHLRAARSKGETQQMCQRAADYSKFADKNASLDEALVLLRGAADLVCRRSLDLGRGILPLTKHSWRITAEWY